MARVLTGVALTAVVSMMFGCGGSNGPSPTAPESAVPAAVPTSNQAIERPRDLRGPVANLAGACPTVSFTIDSTPVTTTASTTFETACSTLADGSTVRVEGAPQADGSVVATTVTITSMSSAPPVPLTTVQGAVADLSGSCPALTFMVGPTSVTTTAETSFRGSGCAALANGSFVAVNGTAQSNGSIAATRVFVAPAPPTNESRARGTVSGLSGTCPTLTLTVAQTAVSTTSATQFVGGSCSVIVNGSFVVVDGTPQPNGSIVAARVVIAPGHPAP